MEIKNRKEIETCDEIGPASGRPDVWPPISRAAIDRCEDLVVGERNQKKKRKKEKEKSTPRNFITTRREHEIRLKTTRWKATKERTKKNGYFFPQHQQNAKKKKWRRRIRLTTGSREGRDSVNHRWRRRQRTEKPTKNKQTNKTPTHTYAPTTNATNKVQNRIHPSSIARLGHRWTNTTPFSLSSPLDAGSYVVDWIFLFQFLFFCLKNKRNPIEIVSLLLRQPAFIMLRNRLGSLMNGCGFF